MYWRTRRIQTYVQNVQKLFPESTNYSEFKIFHINAVPVIENCTYNKILSIDSRVSEVAYLPIVNIFLNSC